MGGLQRIMGGGEHHLRVADFPALTAENPGDFRGNGPSGKAALTRGEPRFASLFRRSHGRGLQLGPRSRTGRHGVA